MTRLMLILALVFAAAAGGTVRPIQLTAQGAGGGQVVLHWSNATTVTVDVYRDGVQILNTPNIPAYPGLTLADQPTGSHVYKVCETTGRCSNNATANVT